MARKVKEKRLSEWYQLVSPGGLTWVEMLLKDLPPLESWDAFLDPRTYELVLRYVEKEEAPPDDD